MGVLAFLIWPSQAMEKLPSFWPSEDTPGWSGWGKDSPFHLSTSSLVKGVDSEAVREVPRCPWSSKHHLLPNAQRNWSGVQKSAVDRKRVMVCGKCQPEKTRRVFPALLPTGSVIRGKVFPPLQAPSPMCKWVTGLDTEVLNRDKWWLQGAEELSDSEGETKLSSDRIHSFYWCLKAVGGEQRAQRASLGKDSRSQYQWRLLVLHSLSWQQSMWLFSQDRALSGYTRVFSVLQTLRWMPCTGTGTSAVVSVAGESTNERLQSLPCFVVVCFFPGVIYTGLYFSSQYIKKIIIITLGQPSLPFIPKTAQNIYQKVLLLWMLLFYLRQVFGNFSSQRPWKDGRLTCLVLAVFHFLLKPSLRLIQGPAEN